MTTQTVGVMSLPKGTSPDDIKGLIDVLMGEIQDIDAQLGSRNRTSEDGVRMDDKTYWAWRQKATYARAAKIREYRVLKAMRGDMLATLHAERHVAKQAQVEASRPNQTRRCVETGDAIIPVFVGMTRDEYFMACGRVWDEIARPIDDETGDPIPSPWFREVSA